MSIPPLVCSTPPPPDQCEDDKEHEDFGLQYNLSQDDDENYDYENFSSYNHYETETTVSNIETPKEEANTGKDNKIVNETEDTVENNIEEIIDKNLNECSEIGTKMTIESKLKCDEDINIEDLNLILDKESICPNTEDIEGQNGNDIVLESDNTVGSLKNIDIPIISDEIQENLNDYVLPSDISDDVVISSKVNINSDEELASYIEEDSSIYVEINKDEHVVVAAEVLTNELTDERPIEPFVGVELCSQEKKDVVDDDFGEFEDFQFVSSDIRLSTYVDNCENPWGNKEPDVTGFGDFTANFDENNVVSTDTVSLEHDEIPNQNHIENKLITDTYDDDSFGDFDDFKSSTNNTVEEAIQYQDVPVLNLHTVENEHQIIENINKVLSTVFQEEISEPETEFEGKLESLLSVTWGHLMETDVRQPYIVNWNNSLGQKTLLKALCIDSRNILFGPKWGYNMPKYAANLTTAPLQPQKQVATSTVYQSESTSSDKPAAKPNNWGDPFSSDGQESCNTNQTAAEEPSPPDAFDTAPTKSDTIFSSTMNVQPLRQINLPDTHIFTPTDSETPRSKTIHYDSGLPVLLPQPAIDNSNKQPEHLTLETISNVEIQNKDNDSEYWDFQDFKSKTNNTLTSKDQDTSLETSHENATSSSGLPQAVQILQPIKLVPIIPTLNWPDPGEVSEVFDDFSDFVSNSSWNNADPPTSEADNKITRESDSATVNKTEREISKGSIVEASNLNNNSSLDDEFDRFQSAIPSYDINNGKTTQTQSVPSTQIVDFANAFPNNSVKSDTISFSNETRLNKALSQNESNVPSATEITNKLPSGLHNKILQPVAAGSNVTTPNQQSGQILQPLSLESYSQINWPSPGIDLQDLSRFNPVETLQSLKTDLSVNNQVKMMSPIHNQNNYVKNQTLDDDAWGDFVSSKPNKQQQSLPKKSSTYADDDEWTEFVSSPSVKPQNGLNTISLNVHTNLKLQKSSKQSKISMKNNQIPLEIPTLNYITPKMSNLQSNDACNERHFQNL